MLLDSYIKSYLEISVVLGIGICHSKTIKSLYLNDFINDQPEKDELVVKLNHALFHSSAENDFYEAPLINYHFYLHTLGDQYQFITIVLHDNNVIKSFRAKQLQRKLQEDINLSLDIFKELSTKRTLIGKPISSLIKDHQSNQLSQEVSVHTVKIEDAVAGLNALSKFARQYVGPKIISNYWNLSKPDKEWLGQFEIKRSGAIVFRGNRADIINPLQILLLREWTQNFMKQCHTIIRDLPERFEKAGLSEEHRKILSIYTSSYLHDQIISNQQNESLFGDFFL